MYVFAMVISVIYH